MAEEEPVKYQQLKPAKAKGVFEAQWDQFLATKRGLPVPAVDRSTVSYLAKQLALRCRSSALFTIRRLTSRKPRSSTPLTACARLSNRLITSRNSLFVRLPEADAKDLYEKSGRIPRTHIRTSE